MPADGPMLDLRVGGDHTRRGTRVEDRQVERHVNDDHQIALVGNRVGSRSVGAVIHAATGINNETG